MAFAPPRITDGPKMQTKRSTWTPLNHQLMNDKVFEERRVLLGKWFDKWTDGQRRRVLTDLFDRCSLAQQRFCGRQLQERVPAEAQDFTTRLPRVLTLRIFSFLDPRSLCRCAQVSWPWKNLAELDQLWTPKCLRFGWCPAASPGPREQGVWKDHYVDMVKRLHVTGPTTPPKEDLEIPDVRPVARGTSEDPPSARRWASLWPPKRAGGAKRDLPPWRSTDRHPTDTIRFNYLDNQGPGELARRQGRKKGGGMTPDISRQSYEKKKKLGGGSRKLRKAKSLVSLATDPSPAPRAPPYPHVPPPGTSLGGQVPRHQNPPRPPRSEFPTGGWGSASLAWVRPTP
ncbi:F-box only protein 16 isoform X1 [Ornithorhynchus anatinus]|uniref:F-box protein 16 n=1 Tax=Ornithorhynchus anatinus TaxID=9258 RepID=F7G541_ORNAN|nr:F-box only protein 16 isoform X1 [Ornithorhynchus anatinus]